MIGPLINIVAVSKPNMIHRSWVDHDCWLQIFSRIKRPIRKMTSASGISERTSVARRGLNKLNPNAANAITPAAFPYACEAFRNNMNAISAAQTSEGNRHATSHDRVMAKMATDVQPVSGGLVASPWSSEVR